MASRVSAQETPPDTLKERIESYFTALSDTFESIVDAPAVRGTRLRAIDRYFIHALQRHQTAFAFIRTNSKGVVISEVVRGTTPERSYRKIGSQRWHIYVKSKKKPYYGMLKGANGRYYLFWGRPVLKASRHGQRFVGAVAAKIDLWDCIHHFTSTITEPFLVKLGTLTLYDHKWHEVDDAVETRISVPGVARISLRHATPTSPPPSRADTAVPSASPPRTTTASTNAEVSGQAKNFSLGALTLIDKIVFGLMAVALVVLLILLWRILAWLRDWRLRRKIEKEDNLFA
jgi:hypothetical protein